MYKNKASYSSHGMPRFFFYLGLLTIGQTVFRPALSLTLSDWFFFISFLLTTSECLLKRRLIIKFPSYMVLGLFLFTIGGIISSCFAEMQLISFLALIKYLYLMAIWFWVGTVLLSKPEHIQISIILWTTSAALSGLGALLQIFWDGIIPGTTPSWGRMTGFTEHVNDLGGLTSIALIPAIMLLTRFSKITWRLFYSWVIAIFIVGGLVLSVSMSGVSALIVSILVWLLLSKLTINKLIILCVSSALFFTVISFQSRYEGVSIVSRLYDISDDGLSSLTLQSRIYTYSDAWEVIRKNPFIGVGLGPDVGLTRSGHVVHNIFLLNWYESGFFGFLGILFILGSIALEAYKGITHIKLKQERILGIALFSSYVAFLVMGIAQPIYYKRFGWVSAALLLSLYLNRNSLLVRKKILNPYEKSRFNQESNSLSQNV